MNAMGHCSDHSRKMRFPDIFNEGPARTPPWQTRQPMHHDLDAPGHALRKDHRHCYRQVGLMAIVLLLMGCSQIKPDQPASTHQAQRPAASGSPDRLSTLLEAESRADGPAREVLQTGRKLALEERALIRGSCWNWINQVFHRAGYAEANHVVFNGRKQGPYVHQEEIQPGDWLYYINHAYRRVGHSGIFVRWVDYDNKIGMILSYGGEGRKQTGRYRAYDLKNVYYIKRPGENPQVAAHGGHPAVRPGQSG
jgi:hypothetical protein